MADITKALTADFGLSLGTSDDVGIFTSPNDPTINPGEVAPTGSLLLRSSGDLYVKVGAGDTEWYRVDTDTLFTSDLPSVQTRRSTIFNVNGAFQDIDFDLTDVETIPSELEHDLINRDRFLVKQSGYYKISYNASFDIGAQSSFEFRLRSNDVDVVPGSLRDITDGNDVFDIGNDVIAFFNANDYISLQVRSSGTTDSVLVANTLVLNIFKLRGQRGEKGLTGSGSSITVLDNGTIVNASPFDVLNFDGGVTVVDAGNGQANISITSGGNQSALQVRNNGTVTVPTTFIPATFNVTDVQTSPTVLELLPNGTDINIKESGLYMLGYSYEFTNVGSVSARIRRNNSTNVAGSESTLSTFNGLVFGNYRTTFALLTAGDEINLDLIASQGGITSVNDVTFIVSKMEGIVGPQGEVGPIGPIGVVGPQGEVGPTGPPGSGSTVIVEDDNINVGTFSNINFIGPNVITSDAGNGQVDVEITGGSEPIFGSQYTVVNSEVVSVTNSTTFVTKVRLTTASIPAGLYRVNWHYQWSHDANGNDFQGRLRQDSTTDLFELRVEPKDSAGDFANTGTDQRMSDSGFKSINLTAGVHTFDLQFATSNGTNISSMWNATVDLWRIQ